MKDKSVGTLWRRWITTNTINLDYMKHEDKTYTHTRTHVLKAIT